MTTQLRNLKNLLTVGEQVLALRAPIGFGSIDCGSYACLLGWYVREHEGYRKLLLYGYAPYYYKDTALVEHFGLAVNEVDQLFLAVTDLQEHDNSQWNADEPGPEAYEELERRLDYLRTLIVDREKLIASAA